MGLLSKVTDPLGITKKAKKKLAKKVGFDYEDPFGLEAKTIEKIKKGLGYDFEKFNFQSMWDQIRHQPERILFGSFDPASTKMWNEILHRDDDPIINQLGGPTKQRFQDYIEQGGDPRAASNAASAHQVAAAIASWYAGGALGALAGPAMGGAAAGAGAGAGGATAGGMTLSAAQAAALGRAAVTAGAGAADEEWAAPKPIEQPKPWDPRMMAMLGLGRTFGYGAQNPYGFERGGEVKGYKKGGRVQLEGPAAAKKGEQMVKEIASIAETPGGLNMLVTMAAEELGLKGEQGKKLRLYNMGDGSPQGYAQGGLSQIMEQQAENVRDAGRGDDEMLLHVSPEEYDAITSMWGEPDINPNTGIPEYGFLSKLWKGIKKTVKKIVKSPLFSFIAPIALNIFAPGLGSAIGGMLGATGQTAATIGNTLLRTGIGAASGGKEGAISGALTGLTASGVGGKLGEAIGMEGNIAKVAGDAVLGGIAGEGTGVGFTQGALGQGMASLAGNPMQKMEQRITEAGRDIFNPAETGIGGGVQLGEGMSPVAQEAQDPFGIEGYGPPPSGPMSPVPAGPATDTVLGNISQPGVWERGMDWVQDNPWLAAGGALALGSAFGGSGQEGGGPPPIDPNVYGNFYDDLPNLSFNREALPIDDYYSYGRTSGGQPGEATFFGGNTVANVGPPGVGPGPGPGGGGGGGRRGRGGRGRGGGGGGGNVLDMTGVGPIPTGGGDLGGVGGFGVPQEVPLGNNMVPYQPRRIDGMAGMVAAALGMQSGWTREGNMMYPPGWDPSNSPYPAAEGGYVGAYRLGGLVRKYQSGGHVRGPGTGRSDEIPAVLSDGEFVIDSETVALLGDGSTNAGAARLEEMRKNLRQHKSKNLAKGGFSHKAKTPEKYMAEGGEVKPTGSTTALRDLKRFANKLESAISSGNKKRVAEITAQLKSLDGGSEVVAGLAKGGSVKRIIDTLERNVEAEATGPSVGVKEKRMKERRARQREKGKGRRLTDKERTDLAEELGGFKKNSRFIRNLRKQLKEAKETS